MEPDGGTTNIRNVKSKHLTGLGAENRCVVPFNSFSEFNKAEGGDIWFALDDSPAPSPASPAFWTNLDVHAEGQGGRDDQRRLCVPHDGGEHRGPRHPSESDAGETTV
jgi:hypothetical protein